MSVCDCFTTYCVSRLKNVGTIIQNHAGKKFKWKSVVKDGWY
nr:MAG TPA: hypothetical protein [Caudoviricetes sp.]